MLLVSNGGRVGASACCEHHIETTTSNFKFTCYVWFHHVAKRFDFAATTSGAPTVRARCQRGGTTQPPSCF
jgi:hypothetical protein